jgi:6-phosphogluconolactonase
MKPSMKRRWHTLFVACAALAVIGASWAAPAQGDEYFVYLGTFTEFKIPAVNHQGKSQSKGIYVSRFRPATGELSAPELAAESVNPSYLAIHPNQRYIYATMEDPLALGNLRDKGSFVRAFAINRATGKLGLLNTVPSNGGSSCYISVDKSGKFLMIANYTTGSVTVLRVKDDGSLGEQTSFMQHTGQGPTGPHAHWIGVSPDNRFAVATDLGLSQLFVYRFDSVSGSLSPNDPPFVSLPNRSGPRHFAFAANGKFGYLLTEIGGSVIAFSRDPSAGVLKEIQTISSKPDGIRTQGGASELVLHPNGKFLYAGNRGSDTISVFSVDATTGTLTRIQQEPTRGIMPRGFGIDPTGSYLLAANEVTDTVILFHIDSETGLISPTRTVLKVDTPTCVKFAQVDLGRD